MVHAFRMGGLRLALDVESGALHSLSEAAFCVLEQWIEQGIATDNTAGATHEAEVELNHLKEARQLFSPPQDAHINAHMQQRVPVVKALCLHMAHECNLRCMYCFAGQGRYGDGGLMPLDAGKRALDFLIANSGTRRNLEVDFFGGEPMLNFDTVKELVAYGRAREAEAGKRFRFTLTTNGAFLSEENIPYIHANFDNIVMSLDGREAINDRMRGAGTYARLLPKIKAMSDAREGASHYIRGTYTRHNLDFAADVLHLADMGFNNISIEPVVVPPDEDYALRKQDLPALFAEYEKLADELLKREQAGNTVHFFHFDINLDGGPCIAKRVTGCGAGSEYLAVTPAGRLFPCHQFVGDDNFCVGDLETGVRGTARVREFSDCHVAAKPACAACWAKYYCSGGCMATAFYANDSIMQPDEISCALMKKRIECALYLTAKRSIYGGSF